jgi:formylglycine-generating enzyme required for sulfatase activity
MKKPAFLPQPFEWLRVSGREVHLQYPPYDSQPKVVRQVDPFWIAKHLITNAQYAVFLQETGSQPEKQYWTDSHFNHPYQPVINLSWQESVLFCAWMSEKVGYEVMLPSDAQWQRAAQGDDNRKYPWGDIWDYTRCNTEESRIRHTTIVTAYPMGASPFGVLDMVGNANEWCVTDGLIGYNPSLPEALETLSDIRGRRIFKGGSYGTSPYSANILSVGVLESEWYSYLCGIRVVTSG